MNVLHTNDKLMNTYYACLNMVYAPISSEYSCGAEIKELNESI